MFINNFIGDSLRQPSSAIYQAILTGNKQYLAPTIVEGFKSAGVMHILAISGLHLTILGLFLYSTVYWIYSRSEKLMLKTNIRKLAAFTSIFPLTLYSMLAGGNTPVVRALIMAVLVILSLCIDRKKSALSIISCAIFILTLLNPTVLFTASFQLSFGAVIFIIFGVPFYEQLHKKDIIFITRIKDYLLIAMTASALAIAGTAPLLLYYFNRISLVSIFANLFIEPLICLWSLPIGFLSICSIPISDEISFFLLQVGSLGIDLALIFVNFFHELPFAPSLFLPTPSIWLIFIYYLTSIIIFYSFKKKWRFRIIPLLSYLLILFFFYYPPKYFLEKGNPNSQISFIDVGQGSSTLIQFPKGKNVLIDGGTGYSNDFNVGEQVIAPYLWHLGIKQLEQIIISHPDSDHFNGLSFIIKHFKPKIIWVSQNKGNSKDYKGLLEMASNQGIEIISPKDGTKLIAGEASLERIGSSNDNDNNNDSSLIISYQHNNFSILLPGDISKNKESQIIHNWQRHTSILLSPHHGSKSSNRYSFLKKVNPSLIVVSSGRSQYFPAKSVINKFESLKIPYLLTKRSGTVKIESDGESFTTHETLP